MAELKARFSLIDEMSDKLSGIADKGQEVMNNWEQAGNSASSAMDAVTSSASNSVSTVDSAAKSLDDLSSTANSAGANADSLSESMNSVGSSIDNAAAETDNWTSAVGSYNKEALEMVYTTEELVEMGYKTADALGNQEEMYALCEQAASQLNSQMENAVDSHEQLADAIESTNEAMSQLADSGKLSAESQENLESVSRAVAQAMQELESAQADAQAAMDNYDAAIISGTNDLGELEAAAQRASTAAENLASAQDKAKKATEECSEAADNAAQSAEESGRKSVNAIKALAETVIAAKIAEKVYEIANAAYDLADAYSEAQEIVVNATGATGEALSGLEQSMMNAYAGHHQDLSTTAGAIGEINTRMALTGDELTEVTGLFLDYSRITGADVVGSVQNVTKVMNQWGVEGENVESVLDRLAYAGQISGASVDNLSQTLITEAASFQEVGLSLDSAIQLLADFELAGINSSTAITAMRTAVNNFTNEGKDAEAELQNVIAKIASMEDSTEATALAVDTFGTRAGQQLASAIRNGTVSVDSFNTSLESADGTLRKTAEAGETLGEEWEKSNNKIKAAFTSALQPTIDKVSSGFAKVMSIVGDFLNNHSAVVKAIVSIGTGLGVAAVAVAGVTFAVNVAIPAIKAFGASIQAALGPIGWISLGATALVGGIFALTSAFSSSEEQVAGYNGTMEECAGEIERTQAAYDKACELYGENSSAAQDLADNLETLNAQFEKGGGAGAVYIEQAEKLSQAFDELSESQKKAIEEIDKTETSGLNAVAMLSALSEQSTYTNADLDIMAGYADYLNDEFNCDIKVNYSTGEIIGFDPQVAVGAVIEAANSERYQKALEYLSGANFQDSYVDAKVHVKELESELVNLQNEQQALNNVTTFTDPSVAANMRSSTDIAGDIITVQNALDEYNGVITTAEAEMESYGEIIDSTGKFTENYKSILEGLADERTKHLEYTTSTTQALSDEEIGIQAAAEAYQQYQAQIEDLCVAYDEVYQSALESFQGQFGLFEQASTESETYLNSTVANAQAALDSQLAYWTEYSNNIEVLKNISAEDLGITQENYDALMSCVQSGSEEAAGLADSMVKELESGHTESVTELANTLGDVTAKQEEIAASTADWITGFSELINTFATDMTNTVVNDLNLSDEAQSAGLSTIVSYAAAITNNGGKAVDAAQSIADRVSAALSSANTSINIGVSGSVPGHATGTTNSEDVFVAGENGPELIIGKSGSTVFPNSETNKIISALHDIGGTSYNNSYTTANAVTDNSAINNYSSAYENYNKTENTNIYNSYTTVENDSSYDDSAVIHYLDSFASICSAIERKVGSEEAQAPEKSAEIPEIVTIVDLSMLDEMIAKLRSSEDVSNFDESVTYGDTQNIDNSRSYSTEYGDNDLSRTSADVTNYGDVARSFENSLRYGDRNYETTIGCNTETSLSTSSESVINDVSDNIVEYGDMIRSYSDVLNYGDTVKQNDTAEQTDISKSWDSTYDNDNSRSYSTAYGDNDLSRTSADVTNYGDVAQNVENSLRYGDRDYETTTSYNAETSLRTSAESITGDVISSILNYGDKTVNYSGDSHKDILSTENITETNNTDYNVSHGDHSNIVNQSTAIAEYGDSIEHHENTISNNPIVENHTELSGSSQTFENGIVSAFVPVWEIIAKMLESSFKGDLSETERSYSATERYDTDSAEFVSPEIVIDSPNLTVPESENRIVAETAEKSDTRIIPPEQNDGDEKDNDNDEDTRRFVIEIAGSGSIDITNAVDREQVLELLQDNLKPVLMNIISNEVYEEGELSYDF